MSTRYLSRSQSYLKTSTISYFSDVCCLTMIRCKKETDVAYVRVTLPRRRRVTIKDSHPESVFFLICLFFFNVPHRHRSRSRLLRAVVSIILLERVHHPRDRRAMDSGYNIDSQVYSRPQQRSTCIIEHRLFVRSCRSFAFRLYCMVES